MPYTREECESVIVEAFPRADVGRLTYRRMMSLRRLAIRHLKMMRGGDTDREALKAAAGVMG